MNDGKNGLIHYCCLFSEKAKELDVRKRFAKSALLPSFQWDIYFW